MAGKRESKGVGRGVGEEESDERGRWKGKDWVRGREGGGEKGIESVGRGSKKRMKV